MKRLFSVLFMIIICNLGIAQDNSFIESNRPIEVPRYELYQTENMWTFLKLDTREGRIWQVQYDVKDDYRFETPLNQKSLDYIDQMPKDGRFKLYPTKNMWTFLLIDQVDGRVWQVQFDIKGSNRGIIRIY